MVRSKELVFIRRQQDDAMREKRRTRIEKYKDAGSWNPTKLPVDFYLINGVRSPGICSFPQLEDIEKWDVKTGPGLTGGQLYFRGVELREFEVIHRLYTNDDWDLFYIFLEQLQGGANTNQRQAFYITHPYFQIFNPPIRAVVKTKWKLTEPDDRGVTTFTVTYREYRKIKEQKQPKPDPPKPEPKPDWADQIIIDQYTQVQELGKE
jgi:hypothetical protein